MSLHGPKKLSRNRVSTAVVEDLRQMIIERTPQSSDAVEIRRGRTGFTMKFKQPPPPAQSGTGPVWLP